MAKSRSVPGPLSVDDEGPLPAILCNELNRKQTPTEFPMRFRPFSAGRLRQLIAFALDASMPERARVNSLGVLSYMSVFRRADWPAIRDTFRELCINSSTTIRSAAAIGLGVELLSGEYTFRFSVEEYREIEAFLRALPGPLTADASKYLAHVLNPKT